MPPPRRACSSAPSAPASGKTRPWRGARTRRSRAARPGPCTTAERAGPGTRTRTRRPRSAWPRPRRPRPARPPARATSPAKPTAPAARNASDSSSTGSARPPVSATIDSGLAHAGGVDARGRVKGVVAQVEPRDDGRGGGASAARARERWRAASAAAALAAPAGGWSSATAAAATATGTRPTEYMGGLIDAASHSARLDAGVGPCGADDSSAAPDDASPSKGKWCSCSGPDGGAASSGGGGRSRCAVPTPSAGGPLFLSLPPPPPSVADVRCSSRCNRGAGLLESKKEKRACSVGAPPSMARRASSRYRREKEQRERGV